MATIPADATWTYSEAQEVEILWQTYEATIPIDDKRELTQILVSIHNNSELEAFVDDIEVLKNLINDRLLANNVVYIPVEAVAEGEPLERIVFGAMDTCKIVSAAYVPEQTIHGREAGLQLRLQHTITQDILCTNTFELGTDAQAGLVDHFGPINEEHEEVLADNSLTFVKSAVGELPRGVLIIQWDIV